MFIELCSNEMLEIDGGATYSLSVTVTGNVQTTVFKTPNSTFVEVIVGNQVYRYSY